MRHYFAMRLPPALALVSAAVILTASAEAATVKIQLTSVTTVVQQHDTKPMGKPNKGDSIDFKDLLLNRVAQFGKAKGQPVAYDVGHLVYRSATDRRITVVATFPGIGTITYVGDFTDNSSPTTVMRITAGTGGFKGARGTVTIGPGTKASNIYVVTVPHPVDIHSSSRVA
jgi:hypothetical protein